MLFDSIKLVEGSAVSNLTVASGTTFPTTPDKGELFFRTTDNKLYLYINSTLGWDAVGTDSVLSVVASSGAYSDLIGAPTFPTAAISGSYLDLTNKPTLSAVSASGSYTDLLNKPTLSAVSASGSYTDLLNQPSVTITGDVAGSGPILNGITATLATVNGAVGTYGSTTAIPVITVNAKGLVTNVTTSAITTSFSIAGDVTGTVNGGFDILTLATVNATPSSYGSATQVASFTVNAKGLVTAASNSTIAIPTSAVTAGLFADARISSSSVTQHQAALTIIESQITDGPIFTRNASNETVTGTWTFNNPVTGTTPVTGSDLATKDYVDNLSTGLDMKASVRAATTGNITLSGPQTIDSIAVIAGDRVLVKDQTLPAQNGIYVVAAGTWTRSTDADNTPVNEVTSGMYTFVEEGTVNVNTGWVLATAGTINLGTTALVFVQFTGLGEIIAGNGLTKSGSTIQVVGTSGRILANAGSIDLATAGTSGTYKSVTTDAYGRVTSGTNPTTLVGFGITDAQPLSADLTSIAGQPVTVGLLKKTGAATWTIDTTAYITSAGAPVQSVAGKSGAVSLVQADIGGLTAASSPNFVGVTATTFTGALAGNATTATSAGSATTATTSTNIAGGAAKQVPFQSATATTAFSADFTFDSVNSALSVGNAAGYPVIIGGGANTLYQGTGATGSLIIRSLPGNAIRLYTDFGTGVRGGNINFYAGGSDSTAGAGSIQLSTGVNTQAGYSGMIKMIGATGYWVGNFSGNGATSIDLGTQQSTFLDGNLAANTTLSFVSSAILNGAPYHEVRMRFAANTLGYTLTWPANVTWISGTAPTLSTTSFTTVALITYDGGVTYLGYAVGSTALYVANDTTTNATYYPVLSTVTSGGALSKVSSSKLSFNPSTGALSVSAVSLTGDLTQSGSSARTTYSNTAGNGGLQNDNASCYALLYGSTHATLAKNVVLNSDGGAVRIKNTGTDVGVFNSAGLTVTGALIATTTLQLGLNPASVGTAIMGIPNQKRVYGRNAANTGDVNLFYVNGSDAVVVGPGDMSTFSSTGLAVIGALSSTVSSTVNDGTINLRSIVTGGVAYHGTISNHPLAIQTNNAEIARFDTAGNLGLGITPSAWGGGYKAFDIGTLGAVAALSTQVGVFNNAYWNGSNSIYKTTNPASYYNQNSGVHSWHTAPSGTAGTAITFTQRLALDTTGLTVNGVLSATSKNFVIPHPTKPGMELRYASLEGNENGVYVRGKTTSTVIELPDYWTGLVHEDSITVSLTPIGKRQDLYVEKIENNKVYIRNDKVDAEVNCFYMINAERKDIAKLVVEA